MRTKVTLVLLFLNVILFYYINKFEWQPVDTPKGRSVYGSEVASIDSFARSDRSGNSLLMVKEKSGEGWSLSKPYDWPANRNAVNGIISELQHLDHETSFTVADLVKNGQSLADYGLTNPALTFTFTSGGNSYETKVGDATKVGNRLYLLSPDGKVVHVVGSSLLDSLGLSVDRLRAESIFSIPVFEVRSLSLQTASKVRLRRDGERWSFETPILARASKNNVITTINALNGLQAKKFLEAREAADSALTGLSSPEFRVTLEGNARRETLLIGRPVPETAPVAVSAGNGPSGGSTTFYAKIEDKPATFTTEIPEKLVDNLRHAQEFLRDKRILDFEARAVTAITLSAPGKAELNLQRLEAAPGTESWQLINRNAGSPGPQTLTADPTLVADLLQKLELFSAVKFLSDAPSAADVENYGFNRPEREITLNLNTGGGLNGTEPSALTLQIGVTPEERSVAYAKLSNAPFVYEVDPMILEATPVDTREFRQRLLRELPEGARITGLTLTEIGAVAPVFTRQLHENETWEAALGGEPDARQKALVLLLAQLRALRAQRFTAESFNVEHAESTGAYQPWKYRLETTLALTGGNGAPQLSTSTLFLTDRLGGTTQLAGSTEFGVTFAVTQELIDALFTLTYSEKHDPGPPNAEAVPGT